MTSTPPPAHEGAAATPQRLSLIAVVARNLAIGRDNGLLWHLPEDLRHFRATTRGCAVIMGRRTWESLPAAFRPLPGRHNLVLTRDHGFVAPGASIVHSLEEAIAAAGGGEVFVIGGAELYRQALPLAQRLVLTEVAADADGDAFFPPVAADEWQEIGRQEGSRSEPAFDFVSYQRIADAR
ncbi:dihydrofolate reductase [Rhodocyclus gracilis]|uniref:Dihydrofolate reductase n=1 Tax=Rhodocyclus tenuis TaxID=1066 RepID=A0A6L5JU12_RHOTE|nr:dihydrofolate reductase [Rhodocyclus gracilis]MQY50719.1 dihydrofolate reductase [Rhodocyclus gracilis]